MNSIQARVCAERYSGTNDNVKMRFKNGFGYECQTHWLDKNWGNNWARNSIEYLGSPMFSSCGETFRPIDTLQFRFEMSIPLTGISFMLNNDELQLCSVKVKFGSENTPGSSVWLWEGSAWNSVADGVFYSMSEWQTLRKI